MPSQQEQLREIARMEWLRTLRNWALGLGLSAFLLSFATVGIFGIGNPKNWSSAYFAMAGEGLLRGGFVVLLAVGGALIIVGAILAWVVEREAR